MTTQQPYEETLGTLRQWFDSHRPSANEEPNTYVMCAGLAVLERMRRAYPLHRADYVTPGNQVRTSGALIQSILERNGEERRFTREGGRTTRATVPAAEGLAAGLNETAALASLSDEDRGQVIDELQVWLVERVRDYLDRQAIEVEVNLGKPAPQIVSDILEAAGTKSGAVAQHLVGAKLAIRYPELEIENFSYTTADQQLGRPGRLRSRRHSVSRNGCADATGLGQMRRESPQWLSLHALGTRRQASSSSPNGGGHWSPRQSGDRFDRIVRRSEH